MTVDAPGAFRGEDKRTLPLNILLKGRLCLLLGAGHVAHRKCRNLLDHGARVVLVSPDVGPGIEKLEDSGEVVVRGGVYDPALLDELRPFLVYAATDDDEVNRRVVTDARERDILASSVSSWREGDFISPSVIQWGKGQVSVTTEGASCRQAKFMRIRLEELLGGERRLLVLGIDLRSVSLSQFEGIRPDPARAERMIGMLRHLAALEEFALLATCNRFELYAWTRPDDALLEAVRTVMGLTEFDDRVYLHTGDSVVEHAANVVAGHYSQVTCETQITGQFKAAFSAAFRESVAGVHLQRLHDRALRLGKRIRAVSGAGESGLQKLVGAVVRRRAGPSGANVLLLGAGALGREVAEDLAAGSGIRLTWANRSAENLPEKPECARLPLARALESLGAFDQVVTVLGATEPVILPRHLAGIESPPLLIDLGLPRNVDPALARRIEVLDLGSFRDAGADRERLLALAHTVCSEVAHV